MLAAWTVAVLALTSVGSLLAHHSLTQFDTTAAVRVKGVIVQFEQVNPHSILFLDSKDADGQIQSWAVEAPGFFNSSGCRSLLKRSKSATSSRHAVTSRRTASRPSELSRRLQKAFRGLLTGEQLVMQNGESASGSITGTISVPAWNMPISTRDELRLTETQE
jgi:Family of unknown function (DUF6152)